MASKFGFGGIGFTVKNRGYWGGQQVRVWGDRFVAPALFEADSNYVYEFGEIVEIVGDTKTNYIVKPIDKDTLATAQFGVIMEEITGALNVLDERVFTGAPNIAVNVWLINKTQGSIAVPLKGADVPAIDGKVYVGNGTNGTVAGVVYAKAVTNGTLEIPSVVFKGLQMTPSDTTAKTVEIGLK